MNNNIKFQIYIVGLFIILLFIIINCPKQYEKIINKVFADTEDDTFIIKRKARDEYEWNVINKKFGFIIAMNDKKIIYVEHVNLNSPKCKKYIRQYDIAKNKSFRVLEYTFLAEIPWSSSATLLDYKKYLTAKSGKVIVGTKNGSIIIEMDFYKATYKKVAYISQKYTQIHHIELLPNSNKICYCYYIEGQKGESIDVFDLQTGKKETILQNIIYRNSPISSISQHLPFMLVEDKAILYVENVNAEPIEKIFLNPDEYHRLAVVYFDSKQIKEISNTKTAGGGVKLPVSTALQISNGKIIWNSKPICNYKDILK